MKSALGADFSLFLGSYDLPAARGIRVNTLKISSEEFKKISPFPLSPVPWEKDGFYCDGEGLGKTVAHAAGLYYVQEPSAMSVVPALGVKEGDRVLDLCAAPGGKSFQLACNLKGSGVLVSNETVFPRAKILSQNIERAGVENAVVTCAPPEKLANKFRACFDKILVDAPCSGEGMFKKEELAVREWSLGAVSACAARQRAILDCADGMLAVGGTLAYSTCTFSEEEDEGQVAVFLKSHPQYELVGMKKLYPHEVRGEGHFYAVLKKTDGENLPFNAARPRISERSGKAFRIWQEENLSRRFVRLHEVDGVICSLPENCPDFSGLSCLRAGVRLGEAKGDIFVPSHSLAACLKVGDAPSTEVDMKTATDFLFGNTFPAEGKGWRLVTHSGFPLGWCKISDGVAKNRYPKGLRINK